MVNIAGYRIETRVASWNCTALLSNEGCWRMYV